MTQADVDSDPLFLSLKIPYLCKFRAPPTSLRFRDLPGHYGVPWSSDSKISETVIKPENAASFLQEWLFFAALDCICRVFDVNFNPQDFVLQGSKDGPLVTGSQFHNYVCFWVGGTEPGLYSSTAEQANRQKHEAVSILKVLEETAQAWIELEDRTDSPNLSLVLLSIVQLTDHLRKMFSVLLASPMINIRSVSLLKSYPKCGRQLLLKAGWCVGELPALMLRYSPSALLYLSTIDRLRKDHTRCQADACVVNQLDSKYYKTAHTSTCQGSDSCVMISVPLEEVCAILSAGDIPLVSLSKNDHLHVPSLKVAAFPLDDKLHKANLANRYRYVAISHVWSDGMGNPGRNALHLCQLRRVQRAVNGLDSAGINPVTENRLFWLDTLCVPVDPAFRTLAIIRMARTYLHAAKVLVIDNWLTQDTLLHSGPKRILYKIVHSDWNTRVWTFQEAVLARECHVQLADGSITVEQLVATVGGMTSIEVVCEILSRMDEAECLNNKYTLNLLRALVHIDPSAIKPSARVSSVAALPPQDDPNKELDRLVAIRTEYNFRSRCAILEKCFTILEKANGISEDIETDIYRLNSLIWPLQLEPASRHVEVLAMLIRGFGFEYIMDRSEDLKGQSTWQLKGLTSEPGIILPEMVAGIRGRTTSWKEDETYCLGSMVGIDISPITSIRVNIEKRAEEEQRVCEERMKVFLSSVRTFPESILFWTSRRLARHPWRWAPASFLDNDEKSWLSESFRAECTNDGLLVNCPGVTVFPNQNVSDPTTKVVRLRFKMPANPRYKAIRPDDVFGEMLLRIRKVKGSEKTVSWHELLAEHGQNLVLLRTSNIAEPNRDAVLARYNDTKNGTRLVSYITNVVRVHRASQDPGPCILGVMEDKTTKWCVG